MTRVQPIIFCFLGDVAARLRHDVSRRVAECLGELPDTVAFIYLDEGVAELSIGGVERRFAVDGDASSRLLDALVAARSVIDKAIRLEHRSDGAVRDSVDDGLAGLRTAAEELRIFLVQGFIDPIGPGLLLAVAEKLRSLEDRWIGEPRVCSVLLHAATPGEGSSDVSVRGRIGLRWVESAIARGLLDAAAVVACGGEEHAHVAGFFSASVADRWVDLLSLLPSLEFHDALTARIGDGPAVAAIGLASGIVGGEFLESEIEQAFCREVRRALDETELCPQCDIDRLLDDRLVAELARDRSLHRSDGAMRLAAALDRRLENEFGAGRLTSIDTPKLAERLRVRAAALGSLPERASRSASAGEVSEVHRLGGSVSGHGSKAGLPLLPMIVLGALAGGLVGWRGSGFHPGVTLAGVFGGMGVAVILWIMLRGLPGPRTDRRTSSARDDEVDRQERSGSDVGDLDVSPAEYDGLVEAAAELESLARSAVSSARVSLDALCVADAGTGGFLGLDDADHLRTRIDLLLRRGVVSFLARSDERDDGSPFLDAVRERAREWARQTASDVSPSVALRSDHALPRRILDELTRSATPVWPGGNGALSRLRCFSGDLEAWSADGDLITRGERNILVVRVLRSIGSVDLEDRRDESASAGNVVEVE